MSVQRENLILEPFSQIFDCLFVSAVTIGKLDVNVTSSEACNKNMLIVFDALEKHQSFFTKQLFQVGATS